MTIKRSCPKCGKPNIFIDDDDFLRRGGRINKQCSKCKTPLVLELAIISPK